MKRLVLALLCALAAATLAACAGGSSGSDADQDAREALARVQPIESARLDAVLRMTFDDAPPEVGDALELRFGGPLRSNGAGRLPSFDWRIAFTGLDTSFDSRAVSTGDNFFIRLGGVDFEVGREAIAGIYGQPAEDAPTAPDGLASVGLDPLGAIATVGEQGGSAVAGAETTRYAGTVDVNRLLDQVQMFLRIVPNQSGGASVPQLQITPQLRTQLTQTFAPPQFEADVAEDDTLRRLRFATRFTTPEASREAAGGITGGTVEYRLEYSRVGAEVAIAPVEGARPIEEFSAALQRELAE